MGEWQEKARQQIDQSSFADRYSLP